MAVTGVFEHGLFKAREILVIKTGATVWSDGLWGWEWKRRTDGSPLAPWQVNLKLAWTVIGGCAFLSFMVFVAVKAFGG